MKKVAAQEEKKQGMSTGKKVAIGAGVAGAGLVGARVARSMKTGVGAAKATGGTGGLSTGDDALKKTVEDIAKKYGGKVTHFKYTKKG